MVTNSISLHGSESVKGRDGNVSINPKSPAWVTGFLESNVIVIPGKQALRWLGQEDQKFEAILGYVEA